MRVFAPLMVPQYEAPLKGDQICGPFAVGPNLDPPELEAPQIWGGHPRFTHLKCRNKQAPTIVKFGNRRQRRFKPL